MHEVFVSRSSLIAGALWLVVVGMLGAGWAVFAFASGSWHLAALLAVSACVLASVAGVAQIHVSQVRICALIRAQAEVTREVERISPPSQQHRTAPASRPGAVSV